MLGGWSNSRTLVLTVLSRLALASVWKWCFLSIIVFFFSPLNLSFDRQNGQLKNFVSNDICRKMAASYRELEDRRSRVKELERVYMEMALQKELQVMSLNFSSSLRIKSIQFFLPFPCESKIRLKNKYIFSNEQKKGRKRKLREDEIVSPTSKPVYKWRTERKRWGGRLI